MHSTTYVLRLKVLTEKKNTMISLYTRKVQFRKYDVQLFILNTNIMFTIFSGYVMVRKRGVWGRLCVESFADVVEQAHSSLKLPDLGRAVCRAITFQ